ncbi:MAG: hypothetical protein R3E95_05610 [Thiolinea sp.]
MAAPADKPKLMRHFQQLLFPQSPPIARRLLIYILMFSSLATLLLSSLQLYGEYRSDLETFDERFYQLEDAFKESITQNYWTLNKKNPGTATTGYLQVCQHQICRHYFQQG